MSTVGLDTDSIQSIDPSGQIEAILDLGSHLRDACIRCDAADLTETRSENFVIAGVGGSGVGGRLALGLIGADAQRPSVVISDYTLPAWVNENTTVLCSSYSGNTAETLACFEAARVARANVIVATSGGELGYRADVAGCPVIELPHGYQPRATVGYGMATALEVAALVGVTPSLRPDISGAAQGVERLALEWGPESDSESLAKALALQLVGTVPVLIGAGATSAVAYRWKCQLNENSKVPAFASELPEADHNELQGWPGANEFGQLAAIFVTLSDETEAIQRRVALTRELIGESAIFSEEVVVRGATALEQVASLVLLGDLVSLYLAALRGVDPATIELLDELKQRL